MDPLPANPTLADLGQRLLQNHACVESAVDAAAKAALAASKAAEAASRGRSEMRSHVRVIDRRLAGLASAIGVDQDGNKIKHPWWKLWRVQSIFEMTPWQVGGALSGLFFLAKIIDALWPSLVSGAQALWRLVP